MLNLSAACSRLANLDGLHVERDAPLSRFTRFGLGGPATLLADARNEQALREAISHLEADGVPFVVLGGGSNLVVSDAGFAGVALRYRADGLTVKDNIVTAEAGAELQSLVDFTIQHSLEGIHTMTGVPGWVGGAIYGNAGAYGRSTHQSIRSVRVLQGLEFRTFSNSDCGFRYRHSQFKENKRWIVLSSQWELQPADGASLRQTADEILTVRNAKYPPEMKCAGSIFKNLILAELPPFAQSEVDPKVVREGKVPSAYFLEKVDAKGMSNGDIHVADYHANLIYNAGAGTATQVREVIDELKRRVLDRFAFQVEEEVQYVGF